MPPASIFGVASTIAPASRRRARTLSTLTPRAISAADGANVHPPLGRRPRAASSAAAAARRRRRQPRRSRCSTVDRWRAAPREPPRRDRLLERVDAADQRVHPGVAQRRVALAQRAQVALHVVREHLGLAQLDHPGSALDRVEAAEQFLEHVGAGGLPAGVRLERAGAAAGSSPGAPRTRRSSRP